MDLSATSGSQCCVLLRLDLSDNFLVLVIVKLKSAFTTKVIAFSIWLT